MKNLDKAQSQLKAKLTNPIYHEANHQRGRSSIFVYVFLSNIPGYSSELLKIGHSSLPRIDYEARIDFTDLYLFTFPSLDLAIAFEKKVRYYYANQPKIAPAP